MLGKHPASALPTLYNVTLRLGIDHWERCALAFHLPATVQFPSCAIHFSRHAY
jgi:hypothetical protein